MTKINDDRLGFPANACTKIKDRLVAIFQALLKFIIFSF
jgi:hypothetical protein